MDAQRVGELPAGDAPLRAQHGDAVVDDLAHPVRTRCIAFSRRAATLEPDSRRAIRRSTIGASTSPTTAQSSKHADGLQVPPRASDLDARQRSGSSAERMPRPSQ